VLGHARPSARSPGDAALNHGRYGPFKEKTKRLPRRVRVSRKYLLENIDLRYIRAGNRNLR